jgi:hypothetical protein
MPKVLQRAPNPLMCKGSDNDAGELADQRIINPCVQVDQADIGMPLAMSAPVEENSVRMPHSSEL